VAYYKAMAEGPNPSVAVVEDMDFPHCVGAYWGEVNTTIHTGFGMSGALANGVMHGIGFAVTYLIDMKGLPTTRGAHHAKLQPAKNDAAVVAQLRAEGAVLLGKVATYEYAFAGTSVDGPRPPPINPWTLAHITGSSSSGSAGAVASGMVPMAIGTDTGGSIRSPAACTGIVGLKPTKGSVPRDDVLLRQTILIMPARWPPARQMPH
jgi:Asp-tRNA(Asn)/Glu-tRNA(Gln) amidotransferase A subunit family amidase